MKKNHASLLAIALVLGISGAIAANIHARPKAFDPTYNWTGASNAPKNPGAQLLNATIPQATAFYGCNSGLNLCAEGIPVAGGPNVQISFQ